METEIASEFAQNIPFWLELEQFDEYIEFETKYRVEGGLIYDFKALVENTLKDFEFLYVQSDDVYYTRGKENEFLRYRFSNNKKDKRKELTYKEKLTRKNNIRRKEINKRVDLNDNKAVHQFVLAVGYKFNFKISKIAHIYKFKDATLPFYTVIKEDGTRDHFIEIEVDEDLLKSISEEESWAIIEKYEAILAPLGVKASGRLKESLFEMNRRKVA
jgi:adenylate cyclase class IV